MAREELKRLLADVRAGHLRGQRLFLFRLDRLTRTGIADTLTTLEELRAHGVDVVSVADGFDLGGPHAEIIVAVMAWAAKMERLAIGERISAARERVEAQGGHWGRPCRMDPPTLKRARELRAGGRTLREIAVALKIPKSTIAASLAAASRKTPPQNPQEHPNIPGGSGAREV
jgi:DNA invertase Pin-like site-specific DNA recombinase